MNANTFYSNLVFNLCLFLYVKALPLDNFWKHRTSNPPTQNGNPPWSACHFPTEDRLLKEVSTPCHFHLSLAASQAGALPINPSIFQSVHFQKWNFGQKKHNFLYLKKFRASKHLHCGYLSRNLDGSVLSLYFKVALHWIFYYPVCLYILQTCSVTVKSKALCISPNQGVTLMVCTVSILI